MIIKNAINYKMQSEIAKIKFLELMKYENSLNSLF